MSLLSLGGPYKGYPLSFLYLGAFLRDTFLQLVKGNRQMGEAVITASPICCSCKFA